MKYCLAQNFNGLLPKSILAKKIGGLAALHRKSVRIKLLSVDG